MSHGATSSGVITFPRSGPSAANAADENEANVRQRRPEQAYA